PVFDPQYDLPLTSRAQRTIDELTRFREGVAAGDDPTDLLRRVASVYVNEKAGPIGRADIGWEHRLGFVSQPSLNSPLTGEMRLHEAPLTAVGRWRRDRQASADPALDRKMSMVP
ncbi:MAG: hypothetical protein AAF556_02990, partial [Pseudomonadota bacterium]